MKVRELVRRAGKEMNLSEECIQDYLDTTPNDLDAEVVEQAWIISLDLRSHKILWDEEQKKREKAELIAILAIDFWARGEFGESHDYCPKERALILAEGDKIVEISNKLEEIIADYIIKEASC